MWYKEVEPQHMPLFLNRNDMFYWAEKSLISGGFGMSSSLLRIMAPKYPNRYVTPLDSVSYVKKEILSLLEYE